LKCVRFWSEALFGSKLYSHIVVDSNNQNTPEKGF
jgi:hypothetical protein